MNTHHNINHTIYVYQIILSENKLDKRRAKKYLMPLRTDSK